MTCQQMIGIRYLELLSDLMASIHCNISNHCSSLFLNDLNEIEQWKTQAANDYYTFLKHSSNELKSGKLIHLVLRGLKGVKATIDS